mmetsp:Transcript_13667/g.23436  ORF Transcript_13667/g.23436 Transcript_13667/m.23436 type:complete len:256 (-) Transcript_13667:595-1362(-)
MVCGGGRCGEVCRMRGVAEGGWGVAGARGGLQKHKDTRRQEKRRQVRRRLVTGAVLGAARRAWRRAAGGASLHELEEERHAGGFRGLHALHTPVLPPRLLLVHPAAAEHAPPREHSRVAVRHVHTRPSHLGGPVGGPWLVGATASRGGLLVGNLVQGWTGSCAAGRAVGLSVGLGRRQRGARGTAAFQRLQLGRRRAGRRRRRAGAGSGRKEGRRGGGGGQAVEVCGRGGVQRGAVAGDGVRAVWRCGRVEERET